MNWYKIFYWMTVADKLHTFFLVMGIIGLVWTGIMITAWLINRSADDTWEFGIWTKRANYTAFILGTICMLAFLFTPSKKDMIVIIAGGGIGNFISSDSSSKAIPGEFTKYVRNYLKKQTEDMDIETKKELGLDTPKDRLIDKAKNLTKEQIIEYLKTDTTVLK